MTKTSIYIVSVLTLLSVSACNPEPRNSQNTPSIDEPILTISALPKTHTAIFKIIQSGDEAQLTQDAQALIDAARHLSNMGAKPLGDQAPDMANVWKKTALSIKPDLQNLPFRGRVKGPAYRKKTLAAGATEILQEIYYASEKANVSLQTLSGQTTAGHSLELSIIEQTENRDGGAQAVCTLRLSNNPATCQWLPLWTAKYNITITNHSQSPVPYLLVTN